jgi:hypothetical protein
MSVDQEKRIIVRKEKTILQLTAKVKWKKRRKSDVWIRKR